MIAPTWNNEFELPDGSYSGQKLKVVLCKEKKKKSCKENYQKA